LAIAPITLTASASGATSGTGTFAPVLSSMFYAGPVVNGTTFEIDLYALSGTGSSGTFNVAEQGLTNAPYDGSVSASATGCGSIGTISSPQANNFTFAVVAAPVPGSCTITVSDGLGQSFDVIGTYTTSGFGVESHHRGAVVRNSRV
jgi:hypothetical protein